MSDLLVECDHCVSDLLVAEVHLVADLHVDNDDHMADLHVKQVRGTNRCVFTVIESQMF